MSNTLITDSEVDWSDLGGGIKRKIMAYDTTMMIVKVAFEKDSVGEIHHHPHTQSSYISEGKFEVTVGDEKLILSKGDAFFAPSNVPHGVVCLEAGELLDIFTPCREDFLINL